MANNDRQLLLVSKSNQLTADWYNTDDDGNDVETPDFFPPAVVTPSNNGGGTSPLLSFPAPQDRSHQARRTLSQKGMLHAYAGELEPEGVRGQEAKVATLLPTTHKNPEIPLRTFSGAPKPMLTPVQDMDDDNINNYDEDDDDNDEIDKEYLDNIMKDENISTTSSQDIESIMKTEFSGDQFPPVEDHRPTRDMVMPSSPLRRDALTPMGVYQRSGSTMMTDSKFQAITPSPKQQQMEPTPKPLFGKEERVMVENSPPSVMELSSKGSEHNEVKIPRQSAPVNVDDSSFEDPLSNVQGIHAMAMEHVTRGEYDMALQAFSQVLTVYLEKYGRAHPLTASAYHNLGTVHSKRASLLLDHTLHQRHCREQALLCFQAAARSARDAPELGPSHPNVAVSLVRIGFLLLQSRQYQNAVITFQEALRIRLEHYGATHALVANLYNNLGVCHMHLQEFVVGRRYLQQALDIQKDLLSQDEFSNAALLELADTLCNIGGLCLEWIRQQGPDARHALDAESAFLEALEVRTKVLGENHPLTNQVRSLHDMVRSIPLPKLSDKTMGNSTGNLSPARSSRSPMATGMRSPPSSPGRPYATASTPAVSPPRPIISPSSSSHTPKAMNMPTLDQPARSRSGDNAMKPRSLEPQPQQQRAITFNTPDTPSRRKEDPPAFEYHRDILRAPSPPVETDKDAVNDTDTRLTFDRSAHSELGSTFSSLFSDVDLNTFEATEENFVLNPHDDDDRVTVISYAQSTVSWSSATRKETERLAYLMQAKAILDAHREHMDSPQVSLSKQKSSSQSVVSREQQEALEDGLAPLGGTWPEVTISRMTPEVLQNPERHLKSIHASAVNFFKRGRYSEALHLLQIIVEVQRKKNGPVHEDVGAALHNVGIAELRLGENYKALQAFEEAVRVRKGSLGRDHPQVAVSLVKVGITLMLLKRLEDSLWIFREALTVRKHCLGPLHPSTARIYNNIGCVHVEFNESKEAKRAFEAALDIQRNALVNDPNSGPILFGAATTLQNLAYLYRKNQMYEKEAVVLRESLGVSCVRIFLVIEFLICFAHMDLPFSDPRKSSGNGSSCCHGNTRELGSCLQPFGSRGPRIEILQRGLRAPIRARRG
jgi:tetratricopeptide (TPR) repeat protein